MNSKEYKITTLKDVLEVVNENNLQCFIKDLHSWLACRLEIKKQLLILGEDILEAEMPNGFTWIDDGKNNANIRIEIKNDN
jgi:hypothetical protein